jgi:GNAT superfamily N-acetyltransferase
MHRRMSFAAFERQSRKLGWKHEYHGGKAHIRPGRTFVTFQLALQRREFAFREAIRAVSREDAAALVRSFVAAFATAPEYADYGREQLKSEAVKCVDRFFGEGGGAWLPASMVAVARRRLVGAALVKQRSKGPLPYCLFVRPSHARRGIATALVSHVVNALIEQGEQTLFSRVLLANEPSMGWHYRFGFEELPDLSVTDSRAFFYAFELQRHQSLRDLSVRDLKRLRQQANHGWKEARRLHDLATADLHAVFPSLD